MTIYIIYKGYLCGYLEHSGHRAGGGLGRLLQDGLPPQVVGQGTTGAPHVELSIDPCLYHLLLPGDGDVPRGKLIKELIVYVFQSHAFYRGEGAHVIQVLGIHRLGVWYKRGSQDS